MEIVALSVNYKSVPAGTWRLYNVALTSWRCSDVNATLYERRATLSERRACWG